MCVHSYEVLVQIFYHEMVDAGKALADVTFKGGLVGNKNRKPERLSGLWLLDQDSNLELTG